ncbi:hypothetical protein [Flavobacterium piscis]|uniref:Bacteriocin-type signal sequence-containing protein n=1 Tax=Flavobacterium piscis TaxID=1114874 RepID=A0ABU1YC81_9FLAO|nr:hypothetical protein [Flavobacterium piscis]MDR7211844.1 hypothetical protein [Flavobacterium piscis]
MKKQLNKVPKLKEQNGTLSGGFASLNEFQMNKIKGGKAPADGNSSCNNPGDCTKTDNGVCTNGTC